MGDSVKQPDHYRWHPITEKHGLECHHIAEEFSYNIGNAMAYMWRAGRKKNAAAVEDLRKAIQHLEFEVARLHAVALDEPLEFVPPVLRSAIRSDVR